MILGYDDVGRMSDGAHELAFRQAVGSVAIVENVQGRAIQRIGANLLAPTHDVTHRRQARIAYQQAYARQIKHFHELGQS